MGLMKVVSPASSSADDPATVTDCQYGEVKGTGESCDPEGS